MDQLAHLAQRGGQVHPQLAHLGGEFKRRGHLADDQKLKQLRDVLDAGEPDQLAHLRRAEAGAAGGSLVEDRQRVADAALGVGRDHLERRRLEGDPLLVKHVGQMAGDQLRREPRQREAQAARLHRGRHLLRIGGREDELHVRRRLLEGL